MLLHMMMCMWLRQLLSAQPSSLFSYIYIRSLWKTIERGRLKLLCQLQLQSKLPM